MTEVIQKSLRDNVFARWAVLIMIALTMFFAYMFVDVLSPLKSMLSDAPYNWNDTVFGYYGGSEFVLNVFFLFLIFAGIILDKMGVRFTAVLSGGLMVIGALIKVYALSDAFNDGGFGFSVLNSFWPAMPPSAKLACLGFMVFGCGCEMGGVTVSRAIVKWFHGKEMALAMGIEMAIARLGVFAVFRLSPIIAERTGGVQMPVIFSCLLLAIGLLFYLIYGILDRALDKEGGNTVVAEEEDPFRFSDLGKIFGNGVFWVVALLCVLYYSAIFPFQKFATEMLQQNLGLDAKTAAGIFSWFPIGAMVITPFLGAFLDFVGKGATMLIIGSILMIGCHLTFAIYPFVPGDTTSFVIAMVAIVLLGISFSLVPASLWPSMPKLIDAKVLGSAYSATFWIQNVGLMLVPIVIGSVLKATGSYRMPMLIFASFGVAALVLSVFLKGLDAKRGYGLELPNSKKKN